MRRDDEDGDADGKCLPIKLLVHEREETYHDGGMGGTIEQDGLGACCPLYMVPGMKPK